MKTFAVVSSVNVEIGDCNGLYWKAKDRKGRESLFKIIGKAGAHYIGCVFKCGSALRDFADNRAEQYGAIVIEVESEGWPSDRDVLRAAHGYFN